MAAHTAIGDVGETLVELLRDRTGDGVDDADIVLGSPGESGPGGDARLTVYLYDVRQNEHLSNDRARPESTGRPAGAALVLDLHYLLTAHPKAGRSSATRTRRNRDQHEVLGRAMQILADNGVVREPDVEGERALTVTFASTDREELLDVWGTFAEVPYQPSVPLVVSPVVIDSERDDDSPRVLEAEFSQYSYEGGEP